MLAARWCISNISDEVLDMHFACGCNVSEENVEAVVFAMPGLRSPWMKDLFPIFMKSY